MREAEIPRRKKYSEITLGGRNPVKRYLQKRRLEDAVSVVEYLRPGETGTFPDFGAATAPRAR